MDFPIALSDHLDPRDVAILFEIGNEKLNYLIGYAIAVNADGVRTKISLDDIASKAQDLFPGLSITDADG